MLKDPVPLGEIRRALVIKLRHHGDVLLSAPVFSVLRAHAPHIEIDALLYADTAEMLQLHPDIAQVHCIDRRWKKQGLARQTRAEWHLLQTLRSRHYDLIIHLTEHPRGAWLSRLLAPRWSVAPRVDGRGRFWRKSFTHFTAGPRAQPRHTVENNLDALRRIGLYPEPAERAVVLVAGNAAEARVDALLRDKGIDVANGTRRFVLIHPASRWLFKCWTTEGWSTVIDRLHETGWPVVLSGAPGNEEAALLEAIEARLRRPAINLAGQLSLKEFAALAARARLFIGVDSAPMHIAAAMNTPVIALFGPSGEKSWAPWSHAENSAHSPHSPHSPHCVLTSEQYSCRPCGIDGCGGGKVSDCLVSLPAERVITAALLKLGDRPA